jgi:hypothetical protein
MMALFYRCIALEGYISVHQQDGPGKNAYTLELYELL